MAPDGGTNVPEGMAWGWRMISSGEPFTQGRPETEKGNDKVLIVLTDGENTYYTPGSLGFSDPADSKSIYSAYGYLKPGYNGSGVGRLFSGTSSAIGQYDYSNTNYTNALNEQMSSLCENAKAANVIVMTVSLDLSTSNSSENKAIQALNEMLVRLALPQGPTGCNQAGKALLERHRLGPRREVQGNCQRTIQPAHCRVGPGGPIQRLARAV